MRIALSMNNKLDSNENDKENEENEEDDENYENFYSVDESIEENEKDKKDEINEINEVNENSFPFEYKDNDELSFPLKEDSNPDFLFPNIENDELNPFKDFHTEKIEENNKFWYRDDYESIQFNFKYIVDMTINITFISFILFKKA